MVKCRSLKTILVALAVLFMTAKPLFAKPDDPDVQAALKNYRHNRYALALKYFKTAEKAHLDEKTAEFVRSSVGTMEELLSSFREIERDEALLRRKGNDRAFASLVAEEHHRLGAALTKKKFYLILVEPHLKRAAILNPDDVQINFDLANTYYVGMQYQKAIDNYEKVIKLLPKDVAAYKLAGDAAVALGYFDRAKKFYSDVLKVNKKAVFRLEKEDVEKLEKVSRTLPETYKDISELLKAGNDQEAEVLLKKRLSLNPSDYIAITQLGNIYEERGDRKMALKLYKSAIKVAPDYPVAHLLLGRLHYLMRKYDNAISELRIFKEKMKLLPAMDKETRDMYINSLYYLAEVYYTLKRYNDYRTEIDEILALDPDEQDAHYALGIYYYVYEHSRSKAYNSFKKAIEIDPNTSAAKSAEGAIDFMRNNPDSRFAPNLAFPERQ